MAPQVTIPPGINVEHGGVEVSQVAVINFVGGTVTLHPDTGVLDVDLATPTPPPGTPLFVAGGQSGAGAVIMTSPDGVAWTTRVTPWDGGAGAQVLAVGFGRV